MKLAIIVGTRPEVIRLSAIIEAAQKQFDVHLIHTGQNYDPNLKDVFFEEFGIKNCQFANWVGENPGETVGTVISKSYEWLKELKPDALLLLGDTNSCLSAYSAKRLKIPVFHIEAGNRCFNENVPEEINRRIIDHISDVNMCYTEHARRNLINEGLVKNVFVVGSPMSQVIANMEKNITRSTILQSLNLQVRKYILVSTHREENVDLHLDTLLDSLKCMCEHYDVSVIVSLHPRTKALMGERTLDPRIKLCKPFKYSDYCKLQKSALVVVSDSGTLTEEASILGFRAVLMRDSTEHPEGVDHGSIVLGTIEWQNLKRAIDLALSSTIRNIYPYTRTSQAVCNIISGYTPIVNKYVWYK